MIEVYGVERSRKVIHDWIHKSDLQPTEGWFPNHFAIDETVIRINDQQDWLFAAVGPESEEFL